MSRRSTVLLPAHPAAPSMTEKQFEGRLVEIAEAFGWDHYHPWLSIHSPTGWPDEAFLKPPQLIFVEVKSEKGKLTERQEYFIGLLRACGQRVYVWRPSDIAEAMEILSGRKPLATGYQLR
jgi:VRR-NUC domain